MGFIEQIAPYIQKYAPKYGIKVCSPIIAQAVLESGSGTSELAKNANNYFGLKYRPGRCPTSCGIYNKIGSEQNKDGSYTSSAMQWMKFPNMESGVQGYFDFINISTYANLKGVNDPKIYLENIKKDGYATSLRYVDNLMSVISKYNLTKYDTLTTVHSMKTSYKAAVDAGHGSNTAGKRTPDGYREHWINVKCAGFFNEAMKRCGIETLKTGWNDADAADDADVPLSTRQQQIRNAGCDISVSWHANAFGDGKTYNDSQGIETLIHNDAFKAGDSGKLAIKVQNHLIKGTKQKNRGVKPQNLAMCNCRAMETKASVLIEIGFMTNKHEAELMQTDAFCMECAEEAAQGVCEYFGVNYIKPDGSNIVIPAPPAAPDNMVQKTYSHKDFVKDVQKAVLAKADGIAGSETLSKTVTVSRLKNNRHAVVRPIQKYLNSIGFNCGSVDGTAGAKFDSAVKAFQKANRCVVDGEITAGKNTWKKLLKLS